MNIDEFEQYNSERIKAINMLISTIRLKYDAEYHFDFKNRQLSVVIEAVFDPKIKIKDDLCYRHVYFDKYNYTGVAARYVLDEELLFKFTPKQLADVIVEDYEVVVAKEVK